MHTILAIDDEASVRESYRIILAGQYNLLLAEDAAAALKILDDTHVDLMLLDLMMPNMSGLEFLSELDRRGETIPAIVVTALNSVASAVDAMKRHAHDYLIKPFNVDEIRECIAKVLHEEQSKQELVLLRKAGKIGFEEIIGSSPAIMATIAKARQAVRVDSTVLITGESGTGKDLIARAIHSGGPRQTKPFVHLCCCAIPAPLVESELFGHEKGAFTGAEQKQIGKMQVADQGTLFLDEIGEMPLQAQTKLLRVIQERSFYPVGSTKVVNVDIRFICATNRDLESATAENLFRQDLYYRINVVPIHLPPLRSRREDIPELVAHFLALHAPRVNARTQNVAPKAMAILASYPWPGNVRELQNTIERLLVHHGQETFVRPEHLHDILPDAAQHQTSPIAEYEGLPLEEATLRLERHLITRALERANHVQSHAATLLGTTRRVLKYKMDQLDIPAEPATGAAVS